MVKADKTTSHYKTDPDYLTLVKKKVTRAYKKTNQQVTYNTSANKKKTPKTFHFMIALKLQPKGSIHKIKRS